MRTLASVSVLVICLTFADAAIPYRRAPSSSRVASLKAEDFAPIHTAVRNARQERAWALIDRMNKTTVALDNYLQATQMDAVFDVRENVAERAQDVRENVAERAQDVRENVAERVENVQDAVEGAKDAVAEKASEVKESFQDVKDKVSTKVADAFNGAKDDVVDCFAGYRNADGKFRPKITPKCMLDQSLGVPGLACTLEVRFSCIAAVNVALNFEFGYDGDGSDVVVRLSTGFYTGALPETCEGGNFAQKLACNAAVIAAGVLEDVFDIGGMIGDVFKDSIGIFPFQVRWPGAYKSGLIRNAYPLATIRLSELRGGVCLSTAGESENTLTAEAECEGPLCNSAQRLRDGNWASKLSPLKRYTMIGLRMLLHDLLGSDVCFFTPGDQAELENKGTLETGLKFSLTLFDKESVDLYKILDVIAQKLPGDFIDEEVEPVFRVMVGKVQSVLTTAFFPEEKIEHEVDVLDAFKLWMEENLEEVYVPPTEVPTKLPTKAPTNAIEQDASEVPLADDEIDDNHEGQTGETTVTAQTNYEWPSTPSTVIRGRQYDYSLVAVGTLCRRAERCEVSACFGCMAASHWQASTLSGEDCTDDSASSNEDELDPKYMAFDTSNPLVTQDTCLEVCSNPLQIPSGTECKGYSWSNAKGCVLWLDDSLAQTIDTQDKKAWSEADQSGDCQGEDCTVCYKLNSVHDAIPEFHWPERDGDYSLAATGTYCRLAAPCESDCADADDEFVPSRQVTGIDNREECQTACDDAADGSCMGFSLAPDAPDTGTCLLHLNDPLATEILEDQKRPELHADSDPNSFTWERSVCYVRISATGGAGDQVTGIVTTDETKEAQSHSEAALNDDGSTTATTSDGTTVDVSADHAIVTITEGGDDGLTTTTTTGADGSTTTNVMDPSGQQSEYVADSAGGSVTVSEGAAGVINDDGSISTPRSDGGTTTISEHGNTATTTNAAGEVEASMHVNEDGSTDGSSGQHVPGACLEDKGGAIGPDDDCCAVRGTASCTEGHTLIVESTVCFDGGLWKAYSYKCIENAPTKAPTNVPTQVPTDAPTDLPTNAPTNMPTEHPCNDGSHECDPSTTYCAASDDNSNEYTCNCLEGHVMHVNPMDPDSLMHWNGEGCSGRFICEGGGAPSYRKMGLKDCANECDKHPQCNSFRFGAISTYSASAIHEHRIENAVGSCYLQDGCVKSESSSIEYGGGWSTFYKPGGQCKDVNRGFPVMHAMCPSIAKCNTLPSMKGECCYVPESTGTSSYSIQCPYPQNCFYAGSNNYADNCKEENRNSYPNQCDWEIGLPENGGVVPARRLSDEQTRVGTMSYHTLTEGEKGLLNVLRTDDTRTYSINEGGGVTASFPGFVVPGCGARRRRLRAETERDNTGRDADSRPRVKIGKGEWTPTNVHPDVLSGKIDRLNRETLRRRRLGLDRDGHGRSLINQGLLDGFSAECVIDNDSFPVTLACDLSYEFGGNGDGDEDKSFSITARSQMKVQYALDGEKLELVLGFGLETSEFPHEPSAALIAAGDVIGLLGDLGGLINPDMASAVKFPSTKRPLGFIFKFPANQKQDVRDLFSFDIGALAQQAGEGLEGANKESEGTAVNLCLSTLVEHIGSTSLELAQIAGFLNNVQGTVGGDICFVVPDIAVDGGTGLSFGFFLELSLFKDYVFDVFPLLSLFSKISPDLAAIWMIVDTALSDDAKDAINMLLAMALPTPKISLTNIGKELIQFVHSKLTAGAFKNDFVNELANEFAKFLCPEHGTINLGKVPASCRPGSVGAVTDITVGGTDASAHGSFV
eukprot:g409.t1